MVLSRLGRRFLSLVLFASILSVPSAALSPSPAAAQTRWLDTSDRAAVISAYNAEFGRAAPEIGWSGSADGCRSGTTSDAHRNSIYQRVNFFRAMAGVPAEVTERAQSVSGAQDMALMTSRTGALSHHPDSSFACFTESGASAAAVSNLYLGLNGIDAINGYVRDDGVVDVGHRAIMLHPSTRTMATGDIPETSTTNASNALVVLDDHAFDLVSTREPFVAWPPAGYVPPELVYSRWSISLDEADFSSASVSMTTNGNTVPVVVEHRGAGDGVPFPSLTWTPTGVATNAQQDQSFSVSVSGVSVAGQIQTFTYTVIVLGNSATATIGDEYRDFINRAYTDFLGRSATPAELDLWASRLGSGTSRGSFVNHLATSPEWTNFVVSQLYLDTLGRPADEAGQDYWARLLQTGTPVATVAAAFYGSPEYVALQGTTFEPWIADLYVVLLGRSADEDGLGYWADLAEAEGSGVVAYRLYQSPESRSSRVTSLYQRFLGRNPDADGLAYWSEELSTGDDLRLAADLAGSDEYLRRS